MPNPARRSEGNVNGQTCCELRLLHADGRNLVLTCLPALRIQQNVQHSVQQISQECCRLFELLEKFSRSTLFGRAIPIKQLETDTCVAQELRTQVLSRTRPQLYRLFVLWVDYDECRGLSSRFSRWRGHNRRWARISKNGQSHLPTSRISIASVSLSGKWRRFSLG